MQIVPNPFVDDGGPDGALVDDAASAADIHDALIIPDQRDASFADAGPIWGRPCVPGDSCDDGIACTQDRCDETERRCSHQPDHSACQDDGYCNGVEVCNPSFGCLSGEPITCSDTDSCTIDRCVEATKSCEHIARDGDGDGDADWHCGGGDCDETDPQISSLATEVCDNKRDDDCDGNVDETDCVAPGYQSCADPLMLELGKPHRVSLSATRASTAVSCMSSELTTARGIVAAINVPTDQVYDVELRVVGETYPVFVALASTCGDAASELVCDGEGQGFLGPVARVLAKGVASGPLPVYVLSTGEQYVTITALLHTSQPGPTNETCATAALLTPGVTQTAPLAEVSLDVASACAPKVGDLVYTFTTTKRHDVYVHGISLDGFGTPILSLRDSRCALAQDELGCRLDGAALYARALEAGQYFVSVGATGPTDVSLRLELADPSAPPTGDTCDDAPALTPNKSEIVELAGYTNNVKDTCLPGAVDAVRKLTLQETSDVLLVGSYTTGDEAAVSLWDAACSSDGRLGCETASPSPVRTAAYGLSPGEYRAVVETRLGNPARMTAFVRKALAPEVVLFADTCEQAHPIGAVGGTYYGNTAGGVGQYGAACDQAESGPLGAPEQFLRLVLDRRRRVVFDMRGSSYRTLLNVRKGPACPGTELVGHCTVGTTKQRSFLDLELEPGVYFVQVDGHYFDKGAWRLDVFVVP